MKLIRLCIVIAIVAVLPLVLQVKSAHAAATAEGVALHAGANCNNSSLSITLTTVAASYQYGLVTTETQTLLFFHNSIGAFTFSGTTAYVMVIAPQPEGTLIGAYAYIGEDPPSSADTAEFFVLYECSNTPGANNVIDTCYGPYGSCPQTVQDYFRVDYPYLGLVQINAGAPINPYGSPGGDMQSFSFPADYDGNGYDTYVVTAVTSINGDYWLALWVGGKDYLWVPYNRVIALSAIKGIN